MAVYGAPEEPNRLNQGDLLVEVPFIGQDSRDPCRVISMLGLVTSHSCDCDKFFAKRDKLTEEQQATWPLMVAPVHPPELLMGGLAGDAMGGRMWRYFPLPEEDDHPALVVDLWREQAVPIVVLEELGRQATLSRETLLGFYTHLWVSRTRLLPETVFKEGSLS